MSGGKVGPGSPPRSARFKKSQSGNPKGRPKAPPRPSGSVFDLVFDQPVRVNRDPGVNSFSGREDLELHPTVKPVALIADAIRSSTVSAWNIQT